MEDILPARGLLPRQISGNALVLIYEMGSKRNGAWSDPVHAGPLLIAHMRETADSYRGALHVIAGVVAVSTLLPILVRPPRIRGLGEGQNRIISQEGRRKRLLRHNKKSFAHVVAEE